jgi:hypothetical protein
MEYDYDMKEYGDASSTDVASRYTYRVPRVDGAGAGIAGAIVLTSSNANNELYGPNKTEVDCMMCHMNGTSTGAAWYKSIGCNGTTVMGPADDLACVSSRFTYTAGQTYDSYNRNYAVSLGWFKQAASAGLGAVLNPATGTLSNGATSIPGAKIAYVPNSENCAACHARTNSDSIGLPMEAQQYGGMIAGYGNYFRITAAGDAFDWSKIDASGNCTDCANDTQWNEFGCKTGMGKRAQRAGVGTQDRFGFGVCFGCSAFEAMMGDPTPNWFNGGVCGVPSVQAKCNEKAGATLQGTNGESMAIFEAPNVPKKIAGKMSDTDVHDAAGMKCATCHNALSGDRPAKTITGGGVSYVYTPLTGANSLQRIDHQMAQGFSMMEKADDINDGTVTCESCHIEQDHPNTGAAPVPAHAGFPALHFDKIDCRTCHIPKVYASPGRLLFRDWTAGAWRQVDGSNGNANHFDFAYDFMEGGAAPLNTLKTWITAGGHTKIVGVLPSMLPVWTGPAKRASDSFVLGWSPLKTRDITAAAAKVAAANPGLGIRINGASDYPMFQGFQLADPLLFESKTKHDLLAAELLTGGAGYATHATAAAPRLNLFPLFFDVSHGITPTTNTLGAAASGGCVMCHSSSNPSSPNYSDKSVGFFDSSKDMLKNGMMQMADYDCAEVGYTGMNMMMCGMFDPTAMGGNNNGTCDAPEQAACKSYIGSNLYPQFGMPGDLATNATFSIPVDGIDMMQLFAIKEGATAMGCDTRYAFFGFPSAGRMTAPGNMSNGTGPTNGCIAADFFTRDEIRLMFKKNLQQSMIASTMTGTWTNPVTGVSEQVPTTVRRVFSIVSRAKNPSNAADSGAKFDMGADCITNPMTGATGPCTDGGYMSTRVSQGQLLGYSAAQLDNLMGMFSTAPGVPAYGSTAPIARLSYMMVDSNTVAFDARPSVNAVSYAWTFAGGTPATSTASTVSVDFANGVNAVTLTVTAAGGATSSKTVSILASATTNTALPTPAMTFTAPTSGMTATITDASTNAATVFVSWGDGNGENIIPGATVGHTYANNGTYRITLAATNALGGSASTRSAAFTVPYGVGSISGMVNNSAGVALDEVYVTAKKSGVFAGGVYTSATVTGAYTLSSLTTGTYTVSATKHGYVFDDKTIFVNNTLVSGQTFTARSAAQLYTVSGQVANGPAGLLVVCHPQGSSVVLGAQYTNMTGNFSFPGLTDGNYTIEMLSTGVSPTSLLVTVPTTTVISSGTFTYTP